MASILMTSRLPGDIGFREISILVPIALAVIVLGVKPGLVIDRTLCRSKGFVPRWPPGIGCFVANQGAL